MHGVRIWEQVDGRIRRKPVTAFGSEPIMLYLEMTGMDPFGRYEGARSAG